MGWACVATRGVHGLGQPKKPVKPTQKNPKKWVGWLDVYGFTK